MIKRVLVITILALPAAGAIHAQTATGASRSPTPAPAASSAKAGPAAPSDLTTRSGKVYKGARVSNVEPDGITYFHSGGVSKIGFDDLPDAVRKQYGLDAAKAKAYAADDAQAQAAAAAETEQRIAENLQRINAQRAEYANQVEDAQHMALIASQPLPKPVHFFVSKAQPVKGGYMGILHTGVQYSRSNSRVPDAMGLNRTYTWVKNGGTGIKAFVIWDCDKNPVAAQEFEIDLYPCGDLIQDGLKYPRYAANKQDYVATVAAER